MEIGSLQSYFTNLISDLMLVERQPVERLEQEKESLSERKAVYLDLSENLSDLQDYVQSLISSDPFTVLKESRKVEVVSSDPDQEVLIATASTSAEIGDYDISVVNLARAQRKASAVQSGIDVALGYSGTFWLGGTGTAGASATPNSSISSVEVASVHSDLRELGAGDYSLQIRDNEGQLEFRLVDADGKSVAIQDVDGAEGETTTSWQALSSGSYDTGRGLSITFTGDGTVQETSIHYTAAGTGVAVNPSDTLLDIAAAINEAAQPEGRDLAATIVGNQLVLTAVNTGTNHTMIFSDALDQGGLGFGADLQAAQDATFSVNGIEFTRSSNESLTDVIHGVTLNLAPDAEGASARLTVSADANPIETRISSFLESFNGTLRYIEEKTAVVSSGDGTTYTRAALADDYAIRNLRSDLFALAIDNVSASGKYSSLREIGLSLTDGLQLSISDSDKLTQALTEDLDDVSALFDVVMEEMDAVLDRFTSSNDGYLAAVIESTESRISSLASDISRLEDTLAEREEFLTLQYAELQAQILGQAYAQSQFTSLYGNFSVLR